MGFHEYLEKDSKQFCKSQLLESYSCSAVGIAVTNSTPSEQRFGLWSMEVKISLKKMEHRKGSKVDMWRLITPPASFLVNLRKLLLILPIQECVFWGLLFAR